MEKSIIMNQSELLELKYTLKIYIRIILYIHNLLLIKNKSLSSSEEENITDALKQYGEHMLSDNERFSVPFTQFMLKNLFTKICSDSHYGNCDQYDELTDLFKKIRYSKSDIINFQTNLFNVLDKITATITQSDRVKEMKIKIEKLIRDLNTNPEASIEEIINEIKKLLLDNGIKITDEKLENLIKALFQKSSDTTEIVLPNVAGHRTRAGLPERPDSPERPERPGGPERPERPGGPKKQQADMGNQTSKIQQSDMGNQTPKIQQANMGNQISEDRGDDTTTSNPLNNDDDAAIIAAATSNALNNDDDGNNDDKNDDDGNDGNDAAIIAAATSNALNNDDDGNNGNDGNDGNDAAIIAAATSNALNNDDENDDDGNDGNDAAIIAAATSNALNNDDENDDDGNDGNDDNVVNDDNNTDVLAATIVNGVSANGGAYNDNETAAEQAAAEELKRKAAEEVKRKVVEKDLIRNAVEEDLIMNAAEDDEEVKRKALEEVKRNIAAAEELKRKVVEKDLIRNAVEEDLKRNAAEEDEDEVKRKAVEEDLIRNAAAEAEKAAAEELKKQDEDAVAEAKAKSRIDEVLKYKRNITNQERIESTIISHLQDPLNALWNKFRDKQYKTRPLNISRQLNIIKVDIGNLNVDTIKNILKLFDDVEKNIDTKKDFWNTMELPTVNELKRQLKQILLRTIFFDNLMDILKEMSDNISKREEIINGLNTLKLTGIDAVQLIKVKTLLTNIITDNDIILTLEYINNQIDNNIFTPPSTELRDKLTPKPKRGGQKKTKKNKKGQINPRKTRKN